MEKNVKILFTESSNLIPWLGSIYLDMISKPFVLRLNLLACWILTLSDKNLKIYYPPSAEKIDILFNSEDHLNETWCPVFGDKERKKTDTNKSSAKAAYSMFKIYRYVSLQLILSTRLSWETDISLKERTVSGRICLPSHWTLNP